MSKRMREPFYSMLYKASIGYNDSWSQVDPEVLERFAEEIVKECVKVCDESQYKYHNFPASIAIEEHFRMPKNV